METKKWPETATKAGGAWPIIGNLLSLAGLEPPHIATKHYGSIFTIQMGVKRALVVSSWERYLKSVSLQTT